MRVGITNEDLELPYVLKRINTLYVISRTPHQSRFSRATITVVSRRSRCAGKKVRRVFKPRWAPLKVDKTAGNKSGGLPGLTSELNYIRVSNYVFSTAHNERLCAFHSRSVGQWTHSRASDTHTCLCVNIARCLTSQHPNKRDPCEKLADVIYLFTYYLKEQRTVWHITIFIYNCLYGLSSIV